MSVLVTGGCGFIGSNIVEKLLSEGAEVTVLDNMSTGSKKNITPFSKNVRLIDADMRDAKRVREAVKGAEYILHQAALPSVPRSVKDPLTSNDMNVSGTLNILLAARDSGVKRVVFASSSSVYGESETLPKSENMCPSPVSPYAVTKLAGELYCKVFYKIYGLETVALRYFNVFGPRQNPESQYAAVIPKFIKTMKAGDRPTIYGNGTQTRDFTFVDDVVQANMLAMKAKTGAGEAFNIACGKQTSLNEVVDMLNDILGTDLKPNYTESRAGDIKHSLADITKARNILGYFPRVAFKKGLERTAEYYAGK